MSSLSAAQVLSHMAHPLPLTVLKSTASTQDDAMLLAQSGAPVYTAVLACRQTAGRGRRGNVFYSPADTGVYLSVLLPLQSDVQLTVAAAVACRKAILLATGRDTDIKWVNDLYCGGRKVAGLLAQAVPQRNLAVLGVGINVATASFPDGLQSSAGALYGASEPPVPREVLAAALLDALVEMAAVPFPETLSTYRAHCFVLGREISFIERGACVYGRALAVDAQGGLVVRLADGSEKTLTAGAIHLLTF